MLRLVVATDDRTGDAVKVLLSHAGHSPSSVLHLLHHLKEEVGINRGGGSKRKGVAMSEGEGMVYTAGVCHRDDCFISSVQDMNVRQIRPERGYHPPLIPRQVFQICLVVLRIWHKRRKEQRDHDPS